jgi:hypothetical protein
MRTNAKDHKSVTPLHKPSGKPGADAYTYSRPISVKQDKTLNTKQM